MGIYKGKKIIVLGGKPKGTVEVINYLQKKEAYVIVVDYLPADKSPGKKMADESWDMSTADIEGIYTKALKAKVNGVFAGIHDFNIDKALKLAKKLNLPCYTTEEQLKQTTDKNYYKKLFIDFGVPVVPEYKITEEDLYHGELDIDYPILVKPADSNAGQGISICYNEEELKEGWQKGLKFANNQEVLAEKYITAPEATIYYILQDGKIQLSAMADRHTAHGDKYTIPLPVLYTFPSQHLGTYLNTINDKVIKALEHIGLKNGMLFIQTFIDQEGFKLYDVGFRVSSTQEYQFIEKYCEYNPLEMLTDYALTGKMGEKNIEKLVDPFFDNQFAFNITFLVEPGTIAKITGKNEVEKLKGILKVDVNHHEGEHIPESAKGTLRQVGVRVFGIAKTEEEMSTTIQRVDELLDILDENGNTLKLFSEL